MPDWVARVLRSLMQVVAGGGLTALLTEVIDVIPPEYVPWVWAISTLLVTICQNLLEAEGVVRPILKPSDADTARVGQ